LKAPPNTVFVFPEALLSLEEIGGPMYRDARAWWPIDFAALERAVARGEMRDLSRQVPDGIAEARSAVLGMLDALATHPRIPSKHRLVLGGFSQGAMLSLDVALRAPEREIAALVLLSGTMLAEDEWRPLMAARRGTPVFQSHGDADPILPFIIAERLRDALTDSGLEVTFDAFHGPHTIPLATLVRLSRWLKALERGPQAVGS
jgi:phospholipase/carboxylesterase